MIRKKEIPIKGDCYYCHRRLILGEGMLVRIPEGVQLCAECWWKRRKKVGKKFSKWRIPIEYCEGATLSMIED